MKSLTPSQVKTFIINCLMLREIPYVAGLPGIGKSDIMFQIGAELNLKVLDIRLSQMLPEDLTGLPSLNDKTGKASYNPFDTFPMVGDEIPKGYVGWLIFLDELSSAPEEVMAAIYSLLLGHRVGGKQVHPKALIVAAGNRSTDSAIARPLPDTLITRMMPVEMKVSSKDWLKWAATPEADIHSSVQAFITKNPDMLISTIDPSKREELEPFNTPRGWKKMSKIVHLHEKQATANAITKKDSAGIPVSVAKGAVITPAIQAMMFSASGVLTANAFKEFYDETMKLPLPWEVAQSPSSSTIPSSTAGKAEITANLAEFFVDTSEQSRDSILQYMNRMGGEHSALFAHILAEKLGQTASDIRLIDSVKQRLNVTDIDIGFNPETNTIEVNSSAFLQGKAQRPQVLKPNPFNRQKHNLEL